MMRSKLAAALVIAASTAAVPAGAQFMAADLVYIPGVAHTSGEGTSRWRSDVYITNVEAEASVDVAMVYLATGQISNAGRFYDRSTWVGGREADGWGHLDPVLADSQAGRGK